MTPLPQEGDVIGKYRVTRKLGRGGMGVVFEATHVKLGQSVAIKMLLADFVQVPELVTRFEREARAAARMRHRNAVRVMDVDQTEHGVPYFVMELLSGHDLESDLRARGRLPIGEAVHYVLQATAAMSEAHAIGIVHRDLKPSNLFLATESDGSVCLKVLDFGISKLITEEVNITATQAQMGTPLYMSPEQVRSAKNVDARTDIWSMSVILYELLAGKPPFNGTSAAGLGAAIVTEEPAPLRSVRGDVPEGLEAIVARGMTKDPAQRPASMLELGRALAPYSSVPVGAFATKPSQHEIEAAPTVAATPVEVARTQGTWARTAPGARSNKMIVAVGALAFLLPLVGAGAYIAYKKSRVAPIAAASPAAPSQPAVSVAVLESPPAALTSSMPVASSPPSASASARTPSAHPKPRVKNPDRL